MTTSHETNFHNPRGGQGPDADEPIDPVEGADSAFAQTEAEEFRRDFTNDRAAKGGAGEDEGLPAEVSGAAPATGSGSDDEITELGDLEPDPIVPGAGQADTGAGRTVQGGPRGSLEALAAGLRVRTTAGQAPLDAKSEIETGISPLMGLLSRVRKTLAESEQLKVDRKVLDAGGLTKEQRELLRAKILRMEADVEWTSKTCLTVIEVQTCTCCLSEVPRLYGIFAKQERKLSPKDRLEGKGPAQRLVRWAPEVLSETEAAPLVKLPRERAFRAKTVAICFSCMEKQGFTTDAVIDWEKVK